MTKRLLLLLSLFAVIATVCSCGQKATDDTLWEIALAEDSRLFPSESIEQWTTSPDSIVRARFAYAIGIVGEPATFDRLRQLLSDKSEFVQLAACFAVGQVADTASQDQLLTLSKFPNPEIRKSALDALSKLGTQAASARLAEVLNDDNEMASIRALAAQWMFRLKDESSGNALIAQAMSTDDAIRERIYYSLMRRSIKDAQPIYLLGLNDKIEQIQIFSINGLSRINDTAASTAIQPLLLSTNSRVQYHAVNFMAKFSVAEALPLLINLTTAGNDPHVRSAAVQALAKFKDNQSALTLMELLNDSDVNIASAALVAYSGTGRPDAATFAQLFLGDPDPRKRIAAAQTFGAIKTDTARTMLEYLFKDPIPLVRSEALEQLFGFDTPDLTSRLIESAFADSDFMPVAIASGHIATNRSLQHLPRLCEVYYAGTQIENKQSALDALIELADSVTDKAMLATLADSAIHHREFSIRKRGRELAQKLMLKIPVTADHFESDLSRDKFDSIYGRTDFPRVRISTARGDIVIELYPAIAPKTVANYLELVNSGFYSNRIWHRVVPDFVIQDGCPRGDGWGSPGYEIRCEYNHLPFERGTVGMATSGKDTGGSQYFICHSAQPHLDGRYTVFGKVIAGLEIVDQIQLGDSITSVTQIIDGDKL